MKNTEKNDILLHTVPTLYATIRPVWKYLSHSAQACHGKFQVFSLLPLSALQGVHCEKSSNRVRDPFLPLSRSICNRPTDPRMSLTVKRTAPSTEQPMDKSLAQPVSSGLCHQIGVDRVERLHSR